MGFGFLFLGYVITINFIHPGFTALLGYVLIYCGMSYLSIYNRFFRLSKFFVLPLIISGILSFVLEICHFILYVNEFSYTIINTPLSVFSFAFGMVFTFIMLYGIKDISNETKVDKIQRHAQRNISLGIFYYTVSIILIADVPFISEANRYFGLPVWIFGVVWMVLNAVLIYSCYMRICLEGDEDMEPLPSRYAFINRFREKLQVKKQRVEAKLLTEREQKQSNKSLK